METKRVQSLQERQQEDQVIQIVVETPRGSRNKYKYDVQTGWMKLSKVMPEGMVFPYDFGFIPNTEAEDGDPLDVLVLTDEPTFSGCQVDCHVLGVIEAEQEQAGKTNRNDRLIAVAQQSILYSGLNQLSALNPLLLRQIEAFFINYQKVRDIEFRILARQGAERALEIVSGGRSKSPKFQSSPRNATSNDPKVPC